MWRRVRDNLSFEQAQIEKMPDGLVITGTVFASHEAKPLSVEYRIECESNWTTRRADIVHRLDGATKTLHLLHDGHGRWVQDGSPADRLNGCMDVDLGISPSTNALPINRLDMRRRDRSDIKAAWVRFPELVVEPADQSYTRLADDRFRYENLNSRFQTEIRVDEHGLPLDYAGVWHCEAQGGGDQRVASGHVRREFADALVSPAPSSDIASAADDLSWLVGGWSAVVRDYDDAGNVREGRGEWWSSWVLEGRAVQDVWISPPPLERGTKPAVGASDNRYGTTIRYFDRAAGLWRMRWINPVTGVTTLVSGRREGDRVILYGNQDGTDIRWSLNDITAVSFVWRGEEKTAAGKWTTSAEFDLRRIA